MTTTTEYVVPKYRSPKRRLNAVADLIEAHPKLHDQGIWATGWREPNVVVRQATCGSVGCAAGWGCAFTPRDQIPAATSPEVDEHGVWTVWGMTAYDIPRETARELFTGGFAEDATPRTRTRRMVKALRYLADLTPAERRDPHQAEVIEAISDTGRIPKAVAA